MVLLGIDFGSKKVGFAIAEGTVATPLRVVRYATRRELRDAIRHTCDDYDVRTIVVGVPRDHTAVEEFVAWLRREMTTPVVTEDERLTTVFAKRLMRDWKG
ncbi:MAG: RuvX/YqgF family protein, partial [bacterium]|nr:RuvX/YqgF family protein [bacterium]